MLLLPVPTQKNKVLASKTIKLKLEYVEEEKIGHFRYLYLRPLLLQLSERLRWFLDLDLDL